jgi:hypothetical protein
MLILTMVGQSDAEDTKWTLICHDCPLEMTSDPLLLDHCMARRLPSERRGGA